MLHKIYHDWFLHHRSIENVEYQHLMEKFSGYTLSVVDNSRNITFRIGDSVIVREYYRAHWKESKTTKKLEFVRNDSEWIDYEAEIVSIYINPRNGKVSIDTTTDHIRSASDRMDSCFPVPKYDINGDNK